MTAASYPQSPLPPPLPQTSAPQPGTVPGAALAPPLQRPEAPMATRAVRRRVSASAVAWGLLACVAVAYLALVLARPDLIASHLPSAPPPGVAEPNGSRADVATAADLETLRGAVGDLRKELADVRSENRALSERLSGLTATAAAPVEQTSVQSAGGNLPVAALRLDSAPVNGPLTPGNTASATKTAPPVVPATKTADAKILNPAAGPAPAGIPRPPKPIETGSVKPAPAATEVPAFGAPVVKVAPKSVGLQIATGSSIDSLRLSWNLLSETHADSLKNLEPRYSTSVDATGLVYNLMAGPVKTEADAKKMCKELTAKAIPCKVVGNFDGAAL